MKSWLGLLTIKRDLGRLLSCAGYVQLCRSEHAHGRNGRQGEGSVYFITCKLSCAGKGQMWSPSDDDQIPEYYRQWAATIGRLGHDEQLRTLMQMSEEDRLIVQRIMDASSVQGLGGSKRNNVRPEVLLLLVSWALASTSAWGHAISLDCSLKHLQDGDFPIRRCQHAPALSVQAEAVPRPDRPSAAQAQQSPEGRAQRVRAPPRQPARASSSGDLQGRQQQSSPPQRRPARSSSYNMGDAKVPIDSANAPRRASFETAEEAPHSVAAKVLRVQQPEADFLGFGGVAEESSAAASEITPASKAPAKAPASAAVHDDLLGVSDEAPSQPRAAHSTSAPTNKAAAAAAAAAAADEEDDLLGGFTHAQSGASSNKTQPASAPPKSKADADIEALFGGQPASQHLAGASMIDFGDEASAGAAHVFADPGDVDVEGEPEVRLLLSFTHCTNLSLHCSCREATLRLQHTPHVTKRDHSA